MILQALLDQIASAPRHQREDVRAQRGGVQALSTGAVISAVAIQPLLAAAPALALRRLDEQVARRQAFALELLRREVSVRGRDLEDHRARHLRLLAAAEETLLVLQRLLGAL